MEGDKILVAEKHQRTGGEIADILTIHHEGKDGPFVVTIGGESGSGKSELAVALERALRERDMRSLIFQQDDYFIFPPKTNDARRRENITRAGVGEVRLGLLDRTLEQILTGKETIHKPLVSYEEDRISEETVAIIGVDTIIVEGTYTTLLQNVHDRVFIDRTFRDTKEDRIQRGREPFDPFIERILEIEHNIIHHHRLCANIVVTKGFNVMVQKPQRCEY